jgi:hypothetical protein
MNNLSKTYAIKQYAQTVNRTVTFASVRVMTACHTYPDVYKFVLKHADNETVEFFMQVAYLLVLFVVLRIIAQGLARMCIDPFNLRLNSRVVELENKLSESEDLYNDLYDGKCEDEEKIAELTKKLADAEKALAEIKAQYASCRKAAQTFLDLTIEGDTNG